jgi:hypothetical protein
VVVVTTGGLVVVVTTGGLVVVVTTGAVVVVVTMGGVVVGGGLPSNIVLPYCAVQPLAVDRAPETTV